MSFVWPSVIGGIIGKYITDKKREKAKRTMQKEPAPTDGFLRYTCNPYENAEQIKELLRSKKDPCRNERFFRMLCLHPLFVKSHSGHGDRQDAVKTVVSEYPFRGCLRRYVVFLTEREAFENSVRLTWDPEYDMNDYRARNDYMKISLADLCRCMRDNKVNYLELRYYDSDGKEQHRLFDAVFINKAEEYLRRTVPESFCYPQTNESSRIDLLNALVGTADAAGELNDGELHRLLADSGLYIAATHEPCMVPTCDGLSYLVFLTRRDAYDFIQHAGIVFEARRTHAVRSDPQRDTSRLSFLKISFSGLCGLLYHHPEQISVKLLYRSHGGAPFAAISVDNEVFRPGEDLTRQAFYINNRVLQRYHGDSRDVVIPTYVSEVRGAFFGCSEAETIRLFVNTEKLSGRTIPFHTVYPMDKEMIPFGDTLLKPDFSRWEYRGREAHAPFGGLYYAPFGGCSKLKQITLPSWGLNEIGDYCFSGCSSLTAVHIPATVRRIGEDIFEGCSALKEVTVARDNPIWRSQGTRLLRKEVVTRDIVRRDYQGEIAVLPAGTGWIGGGAFESADRLKKVVFPDGFVGIGNRAFAGCGQLEEIELPDGLKEIKRQAFYRCTSLKTVTVPKSVFVLAHSAFEGCHLERLILPARFLYIKDAFAKIADEVVIIRD